MVRWRPLVCVFASLWICVSSYADHCPESACLDMMPSSRPGVIGLEGHTRTSQNNLPTHGNKKTPPYYITMHLGKMEYEPDQEIHISVVANQTTGLLMYRGLMMQMRKVYCASDIGRENQTILVERDPIGSFKPLNRMELLQTMQCGEEEHSTISHKSPQYKINETVTWIAPWISAGHVVIRATVMHDTEKYWTNLFSHILIDPSQEEGPPKCGACPVQGQLLLLAMLPLFTCLVTGQCMMSN